MNKTLQRRIALALVAALMLLCTACGSNLNDAFDNGADRFGEGKETLNHTMPNSGALLTHLIEQFSGSLEPPFSQQMDDDAFDRAQNRADKDTGGKPSTSLVPVVTNEQELKQVFLDAYVASATRLRFRVAGGYSVLLTGDRLNDIYRDLQRQDPIGVSSVSEWSYGVRGDSYIVEISYHIGVAELNRIKKETPTLVKEAIREMNVSSTDHYTLICAVNEYLCDTVVYPSEKPYPPLTHTPYGAFNGDAVCEGYATAAKLMLNELGIPCDIQNGVCTDGGGHAWNLVKLKGQWYQMDVTWNDGSKQRTDYLLVTDAYMKKSRSWDESDYPKSATTPYKP